MTTLQQFEQNFNGLVDAYGNYLIEESEKDFSNNMGNDIEHLKTSLRNFFNRDFDIRAYKEIIPLFDDDNCIYLDIKYMDTIIIDHLDITDLVDEDGNVINNFDLFERVEAVIIEKLF